MAVRGSVVKPHRVLKKAPVMPTNSKFNMCSGINSSSLTQVPGLRKASVTIVVKLAIGPTSVRHD